LDAEDVISNKNLKITADITSNASWESNLQLTADDIAFSHIGKGEQAQIQIKLALANKANGVDILMVEEPENHLSHINLVRLVEFIESQNQGRQVFLTTHSSYVLNKLSIDKLCLLGEGYVRLNSIESDTVKTIKRLPGYDTLRVVLAQRVILVEGPSDELVLKKAYFNIHGCLPEAAGIDVIVVRGIGFRHYLNVAKHLNKTCHVVKDNDGDYAANIEAWAADYAEYENIKCFSPIDNDHRSLEPALSRTNATDDKTLQAFARVVLSAQTYKHFAECPDIPAKIDFLENWYLGDGGASKKVDSAIRIFDSTDAILIPDYIEEAAVFD
jgi:predicted ATP-dependent endonuclease of OLD family